MGPELAEMLGIPFAAYVSKVEEIENGHMQVERMVEDGHEIVEMPLPGVMTVVKEINVPRLPSLRGLARAKSAAIPTWTAEDLGIDKNRAGLPGSATRVIRVFFPQRVRKGEMLEGDPQSQVGSLIDKLKESRLV